MADTIRRSGLGDRHRFPWQGRFPPVVERVVLYVWCKPLIVPLELVGATLVLVGSRGVV